MGYATSVHNQTNGFSLMKNFFNWLTNKYRNQQMNFLFHFFLMGLIMLGCVSPSFASSPFGRPPNYRPIYLRETLYIVKNKCNAVSMIPYSGDVYYECPNGDAFWSDVLVPTDLSFLFKNRKHDDDLNNSSTLN